MRREPFICLLLAGVTLAIYWPVQHYGIIYYDDPLFMTENAMVKSGLNWHSLWWALSSVLVANWHPVTSLSFVVDNQLFGVNPGAEHVVNVIFHTASAVLLFLILQRITGCSWRSAVVAAIFAWHPLRAESVAWIAERKDVLSGFFMMLTLWAYVRYAQRQSKAEGRESSAGNGRLALDPRPWTLDYCLALLFFALGLMSKAMLVTLPFLLVLLDFWPLGRIADCGSRIADSNGPAQSTVGFRLSTLGRLLVEKWPFFALSVFFSGLTFWIQKNSAAVVSWVRLGWEGRISNAVSSYLQYLAKLFWPAKLAVIYPYPNSYDTLEVWLTALLLLAISALCVCQLFRRPYLAVGWFWYLGTMLPVIGLIQVGGQAMADRYTYLPLIGPVISLVWLAAELAKTKKIHKLIFVPITIVLLVACANAARQQVQFWKNTVTLCEHTTAVTTENAPAQFCLGVGFEQEGRLREAMVHYRIQAALAPLDYRVHYSLAGALGKQGRWADAVKEYNTAIAMGANPNDYIAHLNFADALSHLGRAQEVVFQLNEALRIKPDSVEAMNNLAWILATAQDSNLRDGNRAVQLAGRACELTEFKQTIFVGTLAAAQAEVGRFDDAIATAGKACALASAHGEPDLLRKNRELLAAYRRHQPYRDDTKTSAPPAP
jgi:tetratricopeptide (TPR) repeat protein